MGKIQTCGKCLHFSTNAVVAETQKIGALEGKIEGVIGSWHRRGGKAAAEWPDGPPPYELIRAVYGKDVGSPEKWVLNLVADDAVSQGWGQRKGRIFKHTLLDSTFQSLVDEEMTDFEQIYAKIYHQYRGLLSTLDKEIERAIESRRYRDTSYQ